MDYKDTVNLPKTDFPMRGSLPKTEPLRLEEWEKNDIYKKMVARNKGKKKFTMPDGPPYANGSIHIGHVLNKVLKDIVIKYKNLQGYRAEFIPGWDCHGLPIEMNVAKTLGDKKTDVSKKEVRELCRKEARKWVDHQMVQFKRLGVMAEWDRPWLTMNPDYEANEIRVLAKINEKGTLYRGEKPVNWCPTLQTALAAAEVEYHDHKSPSIYLKFYVENTGPLAKLKGKTAFVIWTTTPWTIPANLGISLNANFDYGAYNVDGENLIIATELAEHVSRDTEKAFENPVQIWKGAEFDRMEAQHPFMERKSLLMLGDHVSLDAGTGCVHTAPGHGMDDYIIGMKYDLPILSPVGPGGLYTEEVPKYEGMHIWKANKAIVKDMTESGHLLGFKEIVHSYPHNPRGKTPLIFRATPQWFIRMDGESTLRQDTLKKINDDIKFVPEWGRPRLESMVTNTPDWCLSRQRTWGVPIPVFFCTSCEAALADSEIMIKIADAMDKDQRGIEAYFDEPVETFVGDRKCADCGGAEFKRSGDILDVWFDSGVCHTSVQEKEEGLENPADIYLEGSDQHRGWFQTSLLSSMAAYGTTPYKALITHGFVNDAQGLKMSKSKGNTVDPAKVIDQYGAEILRLWVAYEDYGQDVSVSDEMFKQVSDTYRRIRNTMRFLLGNLDGFDPSKDKVAVKDMSALDQWALHRLNETIKACTTAYDNYDFFKIYHALNHFFTVDLSALYLDVLKDRLYTWKTDGQARKASQTVFNELLHNLCGLMAPILSFTAEETYSYIPGDKAESIFLVDFPKVHEEWSNEALSAEFKTISEVRDQAQKILEEMRANKEIGSSLAAQVSLSFEGNTYKVLKKHESELREIFIVSKLSLSEGKEGVKAEKATGEKCPRCWVFSDRIGESKEHPSLCPKCVEALG